MPIITEQEVGFLAPINTPVPDRQNRDPAFFSDLLPAAFRMDNVVGSLIANTKDMSKYMPWYEVNESFNPFDHINGYEEYADSFVAANNTYEVDDIKKQIDEERASRQMISEAGGLGVIASLTAATLDPINLVPVGSVVGKVYKGGNILRSGVQTALTAAGASAVQEAALYATQTTGTMEAAAYNIAGATFLGGVLGGSVAALGGVVRGTKGAATKINEAVEKYGLKVEQELDVDIPNKIDSLIEEGELLNSNKGSTVGAAQLVGEELEKSYGISDAQYQAALDLESPAFRSFEPKTIYGYTSKKVADSFVQGIFKTVGALNPALRSYNSPSLEVRRIMGAMIDNPVIMNKNLMGEASALSVESMRRVWMGGLGKALTESDTLFRAFKNKSKVPTAPQRTRQQFNEEIGRAMRRGDFSTTPEVNFAAKIFRGEVVNPLTEEAIKLGLLPEDVKVEESLSYFTRIYNVPKILANVDQWKQRITPYVEGLVKEESDRVLESYQKRKSYYEGLQGVALDRENLLEAFLAPGTDKIKGIKTITKGFEDARTRAIKAIEKLELYEAKLKATGFGVDATWHRLKKDADYAKAVFKSNIESKLEDVVTKGDITVEQVLKALESEYNKTAENLAHYGVDDIINHITDTITGTPTQALPFRITAGERGALAERTFHIKDEIIEDFLDSNVETVMQRFVRVMAADIELTRKFGSPDMADILGGKGFKGSIDSDYDRLRDRIIATTPVEKERAKKVEDLEKRRRDDLRDVAAVRDLLRGSYRYMGSNPDSAWAHAANLSATWDYMTKLGGVVPSSLADIARPVMAYGFKRCYGKILPALIKDIKTFKLSAEEIKAAGIYEKLFNARVMSMTELVDPYARGTAFERTVANAQHFFSNWTGINLWNDFNKSFTAVASQDFIIESLKKGGTDFTLSLGIDKAMGERILKMYSSFGEEIDGIPILRTGAWTDVEARRAFNAALGSEVNRVIVTPGVADLPLVMRGTVGRTLLRFQSFTMAATNRMLLAALTRRDSNTLAGLGYAVSLGMMSYALKSMISGYETSSSPTAWIYEGIDRSGMLGILGEVNNRFESLGGYGIRRAFGGDEKSRFLENRGVGNMFGPLYGQIADAGTVISGTLGGRASPKETARAIRRMLPFQNLFYTRILFDKLEQGLLEQLGESE